MINLLLLTYILICRPLSLAGDSRFGQDRWPKKATHQAAFISNFGNGFIYGLRLAQEQKGSHQVVLPDMPFGVAVVPQLTRTINRHLITPLSAGLPSSSIGRLRKSIDIQPTTCVFAGFCWNGPRKHSFFFKFSQQFGLSAGRNRICFFRWEWFSGF